MKPTLRIISICTILLAAACGSSGTSDAPATPESPGPPDVTSTPAETASPSSASATNATTSGVIRQDETWRDQIRIVGDILVEEGVTLTIEPGTTVLVAANQDVANLFEDPIDMRQGTQVESEFIQGVHLGEPYRDEGNHISLRIMGTLHAVGTPEQMITFTSDSTQPGIYDWNYFEIWNGQLSYSIVEYYRVLEPRDGTVVSHNILRHVGECGICANSSVLVEHNVIFDAGHELIDIHDRSPTIRNNHLGPSEGSCITIDRGAPRISDNTIEGCGAGIAIIHSDSAPVLEGNEFINNGEDFYREDCGGEAC